MGRVADRDALLAKFPQAGKRVVWNVAEFDGADWGFAPDMMAPELAARGYGISAELAHAYGDDATAVYDERVEAALQEVDWSEWFALTHDFVIFTWDPSYGSRLRESLRRNASADGLKRWAEHRVASVAG